jgi:two-component system, NarL family, sensor histidine kinase UhpB
MLYQGYRSVPVPPIWGEDPNMLDPALPRPRRRRQRRVLRPSMPAQVIAVNAVLVSAAVLAAVVAAQLDLQIGDEKRRFYVLIAAILATVLVNGLAVRRRFEPLEQLIDTMEQVDASEPRSRPPLPDDPTEEVTRLYQAFDGMLDRLELERSRTAGAVLRAQEAERARIARDLHDEANQALTGVILRLQATAQDAPPELREELRQTREAASQAMEELLRLARELRPAALDDLGLAAALRTQVADFGAQTGLVTDLDVDASALDEMTSEQQVVVYRIVQESLSNVVMHADAARVRVSVESENGATVVRIVDDGRGFAPASVADDAHGLLGMRERAGLAGGTLSVRSRPGAGTGIELRLKGDTT